ncbi:type I secretion system permease/ATPase [Celeribacter sp. ULVN23_4]
MADQYRIGHDDLSRARRDNRALFWIVGLFSFCINLLMLTGPLFMLQVYDRVLGSGSDATLLALCMIVGFLYLMMGLLDGTRARLMSRIGARFQSRLEDRIFRASLRHAVQKPQTANKIPAYEQLSAIRRFFASPACTALYDLPFTLVFLAGIALFHPILGLLAVTGGAGLITAALLHRYVVTSVQNAQNRTDAKASAMAHRVTSAAEVLTALGMRENAYRRWLKLREEALSQTVQREDLTHGFSAASRMLRLLLQSAMLAFGAWLVLGGEISPGAMIASSILLGRALHPVDLLIGHWATVQQARSGWRDLAHLLHETPPEARRTALPLPRARLDVDRLSVRPPGQQRASLRMISFDLSPGEAMGVIGPTGAGKSTLARALTGVWPPANGAIRLDGAKLSDYGEDRLGAYIGYLPQQVPMFDGTIAENIAKLSPMPDADTVIAAAQKAGAHELILSLPEGYDTALTSTGTSLSGGQLQRIGLARAFYGNPALVILDEPNANLDATGSEALNKAIRRHKKDGGAVLIMAHRPSALQECEKLLVLDGGLQRAFGPREQVLAEMVRNSSDLLKIRPVMTPRPSVHRATGLGGVQ